MVYIFALLTLLMIGQVSYNFIHLSDLGGPTWRSKVLKSLLFSTYSCILFGTLTFILDLKTGPSWLSITAIIPILSILYFCLQLYNYLAEKRCERQTHLTLKKCQKIIKRKSGNLVFRFPYASVTKLPTGLVVKGNLDVSYFKNLTKLPDDIHVDGNIMLSNFDMSELSNG
jgi:hypothetical protein